jgi:glutamyl-tRNA synthetase
MSDLAAAHNAAFEDLPFQNNTAADTVPKGEHHQIADVLAGTCRSLSEEERREKARLRTPAVRIRVPDRTVSFTDGLQGPFSQNLLRECGDFLLRRSDGVFAYQLAVVVDDALMGVNQVVRGEDLLDSAPRQLWLQEQLGYEHPDYFHVPLLYGGDGHRLSKRQRDVDLGAIRDGGTRPEQVVGQLAFWAGLIDKPEIVSAEELVGEFSWQRVRKEAIVVE